MAIKYYTQNAVGTAAERAAATWTGLASGYRFFETDTGLEYYWNGTAWVAVSSAAAVETITGAKTFNDQKFILRNPAGTKSLTFVNPAITNDLTAKFIEPYNFMVMKDGSNYIAKKDNWAIESSNSAAETVIQYAIDNAPIGGVVGVKGAATANRFTLTDNISLVNKNVTLAGYNPNGSFNGAVLLKGYATAEPLIDITNTGYAQNALQNIGIIGNDTPGDIGVKWELGRGNIINNVYVSHFATGMEWGNFVNCDIHNLYVELNNTYGIHFVDKINTTRMYGGAIRSNPTNLLADSSTANSLQIFGTEFEGASTGYINGLNIASSTSNILFIGCSFEVNAQIGVVSVLDNGNNNTYIKCEFNSDVDFTPIQFGSTSKNNSLINCEFIYNTAGSVFTVLIDSGSIGCNFIDNRKATNTTGTVVLTDNGTLSTRLGNSQIGAGWEDRFPNVVKVDNYLEQKAVIAPSSPATGFVRAYPKTIDANNDGWFVKRRLNGAVIEVQIG